MQCLNLSVMVVVLSIFNMKPVIVVIIQLRNFQKLMLQREFLLLIKCQN